MSNITRTTKNAIKNYGFETCVELFNFHHNDGEGASTLAYGYNMRTNQVNAAINAGREITEKGLTNPASETKTEATTEAKTETVDALAIMQEAQVGTVDNPYELVEVLMLWSEGSSDENVVFPTIADFSFYCWTMANTEGIAAPEGCYLKTKFKLTFAGGATYTGRIDVKPGDTDVANHIKSGAKYMSEFYTARGEHGKAVEVLDIALAV